MYNNIGGKIKGLAKFVCILGIVVSIIAALVVAVAIGSTSRYTYGVYGGGGGSVGAAVFLFILIAGLGSLFSWLGSLRLYGYGQLIENSDRIREDVAAKRAGTPPAPGRNFDPVGIMGPAGHPVHEPVFSAGVPDVSEKICPKCGMSNEADSVFCCGCGTRL